MLLRRTKKPLSTAYRVLVRRRSGERLEPNFMRLRHIRPIPTVMILGAISNDSSLGYPKHTDYKFVDQSSNSTYSIAIYEQHLRGSFPTG
ncbi:hypothetical protein TNCV_1397151 [Trichonephila clavipes]|nr:hypothetical protein TNCV_1397151 [Trichonephila clavipes]